MELPFKRQMDTFVDDVKDQLGGILLLICVIWGVFFLDFIPGLNLENWFALRPRSLWGLIGIITMPFVHSNWAHIVSNTIPLVIMTLIMAALQPKIWWKIVGMIAIVGGALSWLLGGSNTTIVGASGVVLGLVTFLIAPGGFLVFWWIYSRVSQRPKPFPFQISPIPLIVSAVVGFFCLDNLVFGLIPVFPLMSTNVSWLAHWCGAIAGVAVAWFLARDASKSSPAPPARKVAA